MYYAEQSSLHPEEGFDNNITAVLNEVGAAPNTVASAIDVIDYTMDNPITLTGIVQDEQLWDSFWIIWGYVSAKEKNYFGSNVSEKLLRQ